MRCAHPGKRASSSGRGAHCWGSCYCAASTAPSWCTRACSCGALQDLFRQGEVYVPVKLLGVNANLPMGQGAERPPRGVGNGKMPVTAGEIGLSPCFYGDGRQFMPGFFPVERRQQRPTRFVAGSSGEGAGRDFHSASMMSDSDGSLGRRFFSRSTRMATPTISTSRPHRLITTREVVMGRAISTAPRTVVMTAGRMP